MELARAEALLQTAPRSDHSSAEKAVRELIHLQRERSELFGRDLFLEPTWDLLLALYQAELEQRQLSTTSLVGCVDVPTSTALRWMAALEERGWVERTSDRLQASRSRIRLSTQASSAMRVLIQRFGTR